MNKNTTLYKFLIQMGEKPTGNRREDMKLARKYFIKRKANETRPRKQSKTL